MRSNISTPGYLSEENKLIRKDICTSMVTAALFTIAKIQKPPKDISVDKWIKKVWYMCTIEHYSSMKRMKSCHLQQHGRT